ncbi:thioredoxin family protein [Algivirga pacifica]|uniref:Thioredoxin domain-containing protein n=1 Tax=Algivirga pacifica TaxID=1162670 RepID=A0ABP9DRC0_9BACT
MMKKTLVTCLALMIATFSMAAGITFEHTAWKEVLKKAKQENKLIFVDAYATWCGPCKYMSANTFTDESVGALFNNYFINFKIDMESEAAKEFGYEVAAYPTLLFIDGDGKVVHKQEGAMGATDFRTLGKKVLEENGVELPDNGIEFEHTSWEEVLKKAKKEKKLIFVDAYATWCGPCKYMSADVFTDDQVGNYYNETFVNFKMDMESEAAKEFDYEVAAYPTLLFIDHKGKVVHRVVGAQSIEDFLVTGQNASNPDTQVYSMYDSYMKAQSKGKTYDMEQLSTLLLALKQAGEDDKVVEVGASCKVALDKMDKEEWIASEEVFTVMLLTGANPEEKYYDYVLSNKEQVINNLGADWYNTFISIQLEPYLQKVIEGKDKEGFEKAKKAIMSLDGKDPNELQAVIAQLETLFNSEE